MECSNETPFRDDYLMSLCKHKKALRVAERIYFEYCKDKGIDERGDVSYHRVAAHFITDDAIYDEVLELSHLGAKSVKQTKKRR